MFVVLPKSRHKRFSLLIRYPLLSLAPASFELQQLFQKGGGGLEYVNLTFDVRKSILRI
jgi:hypothetical protein